jgi:hypothetical protein
MTGLELINNVKEQRIGQLEDAMKQQSRIQRMTNVDIRRTTELAWYWYDWSSSELDLNFLDDYEEEVFDEECGLYDCYALYDLQREHDEPELALEERECEQRMLESQGMRGIRRRRTERVNARKVRLAVAASNLDIRSACDGNHWHARRICVSTTAKSKPLTHTVRTKRRGSQGTSS